MALQEIHRKNENADAQASTFNGQHNFPDKNNIIDHLKKTIILMRSPAYFIQLFKIDESGYGLLLADDMETLIESFNKSDTLKSLQCGMQQVSKTLKSFISSELNDEYETTKTNLKFLKNHLQQLTDAEFKIPKNLFKKIESVSCAK